jgi:PAS domain S-box-containing protein
VPVVDQTGLLFTHLSTEDGLAQTRVTNIVQDDRGFMWFGTQYGLDRFDGYKFKIFVHDPRRPNSLGSVYITALFKDRSGILWIGCAQGVDRFDPVSEEFTHFKVETESSSQIAARVIHICQDRDGMIWLATGAGLHRLDPATGQIRHFRHNPADPASLGSDDIKSSGEDRQGTFWVATSEGLDAMDRATGQVTEHIPLAERLHLGFYEDRFGIFWIYFTTGSGLATYDRKTHRLTQYVFGDQTPPGGPALTGVRAMLEDDNGELWLATFGSGVLHYDRKHRQFIRYRHDPSDVESLAENIVIDLYKDREGNIWTSLHSHGPNHFNTRPPRFQQFRREPLDPNGLESDFVTAMYEDHRGRLWLGSDDALIRFDRPSGRYVRYSSGLGPKPTIITIAEDRQGTIWVGTYRQGLARFDEKTGRFQIYSHRAGDASSLSDDTVRRIFIDHGGTMWVGTSDGLNRFDAGANRFQAYKVDEAVKGIQAYITIAEDRAGIFWLGSISSGLHRFDPATGRFTVYKSNPSDPDCISDDTVASILPNDSGTMWIGTQAGLDKFDPRTGKFTPVHDGGAPLARAVDRILPDRHGNLWMSTNLGLSVLDPRTGEFRHYSKADGLPGNDLTGWETGCLGLDGRMYFGGFSGGVSFYPDQVTDDGFVPNVVLTDFRLPYAPKESPAARFLAGGIYPADRIVLSHDENSVSLEFAALSYFNSQTNRYRCRLEGLDKDWNEVSSYRRTATYTTLPAGSYIFRVQGATARGRWSEPGIALHIEILRPWWQTWWLRGTAAAMVLAAAAAAVRLRLQYLRRREREFRTLADNAPDMVMRLGRDLRYLYVSPTVARCAGLSQQEMMGRTNEELGDSGKNIWVPAESVRQVFADRMPVTREGASVTRQGKRYFESRLIPEFDDRRAIKSVLVITRDITEQKKSEEALRETQDELARVGRVTAMGELAASIAHEVNQPLAAIVTNGQAGLRWLDRSPPDLREIRQSVEHMVRDGIRGGEVVARIRALVKKQAPSRHPLDLNEIIHEIAEMFPMPVDGPAMRIELADDLPRVVADRIQVQQVLVNLIRNAVDAMRAVTARERVLYVRTRRDGVDFVCAEVSDTGVGVAPEQLPRLFDPFYTTKTDGLGMGLSICRSIIESHGGRLWAEPNPGFGMTFRFTLPAADGKAV